MNKRKEFASGAVRAVSHMSPKRRADFVYPSSERFGACRRTADKAHASLLMLLILSYRYPSEPCRMRSKSFIMKNFKSMLAKWSVMAVAVAGLSSCMVTQAGMGGIYTNVKQGEGVTSNSRSVLPRPMRMSASSLWAMRRSKRLRNRPVSPKSAMWTARRRAFSESCLPRRLSCTANSESFPFKRAGTEIPCPLFRL